MRISASFTSELSQHKEGFSLPVTIMFPFYVLQLKTVFDKQTAEKAEKIEKEEEVQNENAKKGEKKAENNLLSKQRSDEEFILFQLTDAWGM